MAGRILIVEGMADHRILLRGRLAKAFYQVSTAESGTEALTEAAASRPDLVIASTRLSDMCGGGFCTRLRALPGHGDTPLILLCEDDQPEQRLALLAMGADDVIARPASEILLLPRMRNLLRRARAQDEMHLHSDTKRALGLSDAPRSFERPSRISLISMDPAQAMDPLAARLRIGLGAQVQVALPEHLLKNNAIFAEVIVLIDPGSDAGAGLALLSQLRTARAQRRAALVYVTDAGRATLAAQALDLGADELLHHGADPLELALRLPRLIARGRCAERHRAALRSGLRDAMIDPLTGLYNRRYAMPELARMAQKAAQQAQPLALLVADLDHFKAVNDRWGHSTGDRALAASAQALSETLREGDLLARLGGEEFLIALPGCTADEALATARRLRHSVARLALPSSDRMPDAPACLALTVSIGVALVAEEGDPVEAALVRADGALYAAKQAGRNRVRLARPETPLPRRIHLREVRQM
ncbi:diguanylate cyclase [Salipiger mangrovisoli]|uniref:diguanylate cyclase n=1 Tax=Salipiger mangrovisoli TaxID=2865933 RepID=A0ABR9X8R9_9RHOB|nr:diguanylate cyclase [Salipiger mangrovisoli]MBE9639938.1 diguanylate cyclase [Salipiger mangrovisoli]